MTKLEKLQIKARKSIDFLSMHPAICSSINDVFSAISFSILSVCKHGEENRKHIQLTIHSKRAKKFKKEFDKELKRIKKEDGEKEYQVQKHFATVWKTYEQIYNEPWKFDHVEYWGRISFFVFHGKNTGIKFELDPRNWQRYEGFSVTARTFEEMIIKLTSRFKSVFGDFEEYDFKTKQENQNNKTFRPFLFKKIKGSNSSRLLHNPKHIRVSDAELNRRWLKWFVKTDYCKKYWEGTFKV